MPNNPAVLTRDCQATQVPYGNVEILRAGAQVRIMQSLGGSYTVATDMGAMMRIDAI